MGWARASAVFNILILEDQTAVSNLIEEIIKGLDEQPIHTEQAASIKEAHRLFGEKQWHGMVADLNLSDGQSLEFIAELRERQINIPIILTSGFFSPERVQKAKRLGIKHILPKPFHPEDLLECLRKSLFNSDTLTFQPKSHRPSSIVLQGPLLPEMFAMDRHLGLLSRMLNEISQHKDVVQICASALSLAMDMVHAQRGFMALFERRPRELILIAHQTSGKSDAMQGALPSCKLEDTPFAPLISEDEDFIQMLSAEAGGPPCWPGITAACDYTAIVLRLQGVPMGVLCLMECDGGQALDHQIKHMLGLLMAQLDTLLDNSAVHAALEDSMKETLIVLAHTLEARDRYTKDHSARVSAMSVRFATDLGLDDEFISLVRTGGLLHDIGKVGVPDAVLLKPGRYTDKEFAIMKAHPAIGDNILKHMDTLTRERQVVRSHHERWDGQGYPDNLKGEAIPLEARIACVADSIDAMTTHRVYRQAQSLSFCLEQLKLNSGTQFDAQVVEVAVAAIERGNIRTQAMAENGDRGNVIPVSFTEHC